MGTEVKWFHFLFGGVFAILLLVTVTLSSIYILQVIPTANLQNPENTKTLFSVISLGVQGLALMLGLTYFIKNLNYDKQKNSRHHRNELLETLAKEYKDIREFTKPFFYADFKTDDDLKKFKDSVTELFTTITVFVENSETIFDFKEKEYSKLFTPSSILQTNQLFSLRSVEELKKHDLSAFKSQFSSSLVSALGVCWSGLK